MSFATGLPFYTPQWLGFYLPPLLAWAALALLPFLGLRWVLARMGFYRFVWHRPLFDTALYVLVFGAVIFALPALQGGTGWL